MAEHDLTHKVSAFCDVHLLVAPDGPLDFLVGQAEYFSQEDILNAKAQLLGKTKNVSVSRLHAALHCCGAAHAWRGRVGCASPCRGLMLDASCPFPASIVCCQVDGQIRALEELHGDDFQPPEGKSPAQPRPPPSHLGGEIRTAVDA